MKKNVKSGVVLVSQHGPIYFSTVADLHVGHYLLFFY